MLADTLLNVEGRLPHVQRDRKSGRKPKPFVVDLESHHTTAWTLESKQAVARLGLQLAATACPPEGIYASVARKSSV